MQWRPLRSDDCLGHTRGARRFDFFLAGVVVGAVLTFLFLRRRKATSKSREEPVIGASLPHSWWSGLLTTSMQVGRGVLNTNPRTRADGEISPLHSSPPRAPHPCPCLNCHNTQIAQSRI